MKKYILMFIICVSSFMIYTNNVKANVLSEYKHFNDNYIICSSGYGYCQENLNIFLNKGIITGTVYFSFVSDPQIIVNSVTLFNANNRSYTCQLGADVFYSDNNNGYHLFTALCPIDINDGGVTRIRFNYDDQYYNGNSFKFFISDYYNLYVDMTAQDYSTILSIINTNITTLNSSLGGKIDNVSTKITNIYNQITNSNTKLEDIKSKLDSLNSASTNISNNTEQIKNDIKDSSIDNNNATGTINNLSDQLATDNTITSLLLLPINFINVLIDGLSGQCVPYSLGELWGTEIVLPCVNLYNTFGAIWYMVDTGLSALVIFKMSKYFIRLFNKLTNLKDGGLEEAYS